MSAVYELTHSKTNIFLIEGTDGCLLFDTGWAGSMDAFESSLHAVKKSIGDISYVLMSHYHPDHCGLAQELADNGAVILALDLQVPFLHCADEVYEKGTKPEYKKFRPIDDSKVKVLTVAESRDFLDTLGISGEILHTPGHSDDSVSLLLDEGVAFVGDLNPLYELELHKGTQIADSWDKILSHKLKVVYYGHAKKHVFEKTGFFKLADLFRSKDKTPESETFALVSSIMRMIDKETPIDIICKKTGADRVLVEDINRMYLTHPGVGVQGILDRIEIKGR